MVGGEVVTHTQAKVRVGSGLGGVTSNRLHVLPDQLLILRHHGDVEPVQVVHVVEPDLQDLVKLIICLSKQLEVRIRILHRLDCHRPELLLRLRESLWGQYRRPRYVNLAV